MSEVSYMAHRQKLLHTPDVGVGWELLESDLQRCSVRNSLFTRSGLWEMTRCSCKTKEHQQQQENQITNTQTKQNHKHTNKTIET